MIGTLPMSGSLSVTASLTGLVGRLLQISSSTLSATPAINTPVLQVSMSLEGGVTAAFSLSAPDLQIHLGTIVPLNGAITGSWILANPALDADQFARSPPDRVIIVPAEDRTIINEA